jgi:serine/threonine protein kinase
MPLSPGVRLGSYEIVGPLGKGGMGEVYRATDTRLGRPAAIKALPAGLADDPPSLARFEREARLLASINHPNIAAVYGLEQIDDMPFLAMELVEGEDLAGRIARGPIPLHDALPIAHQIAEALEAAHERGIIHRDLKPANVRVTPEGKVKVLDFGLAKSSTGEPTHLSSASQSPTLAHTGTAVGLILGTAAYMAPEQARGQAVDKRADIWAFGCVVYEMLAARRPFGGETVTDLIVSVMSREPDWTPLLEGTPLRLIELLQHCLKKDPRERLRDIGDARIEIDDVLRQPQGSPMVPAFSSVARPSRSMRTALSLAVAAAAGAIAAVLFMMSRAVAPDPAVGPPGGLVRASIELPATAPLALGTQIPLVGFDSNVLALSPDSRYLAYVGQSSSGTMLYLRELAGTNVTPLAGTSGAIHAFFSPDGRWLGFLTNDKVKRVALNGGAPITIADAQEPVRARWTRDDVIYFTEHYGNRLSRVPAAGGTSQMVGPAEDNASKFSDVLPDGRWALRTDSTRSVSGDYADVSLVSLTDGTSKILVQGGYDARFVPPASLLFGRSGTLYAVAFDPQRGEVSGDPQPLASGVSMEAFFVQVHAAASDPTALAYVPGVEKARGRLAFVDSDGRTDFVPSPPMTFGVVDLSPDGRRIAVHVGDVTDHIWIYDLERREGRRLPIGERSGWPIWTTDSESVTFRAWQERSSASRVVSQRLGGSGAAEELVEAGAAPAAPYSWSPDGTVLAVSMMSAERGIAFVKPGSAPQPAGKGAYTGLMPTFSPDGRWVAYGSVETGQTEIFVRSYPDSRIVRQVSVGGGIEPVWCPCDELFYRNGNRWFSVTTRTAADLQWDPPRLRFETDFIDTPGRSYDVSADGKRLLVVKRTEPDIRNRIELLLNWTAALPR